MADIQKSNSEAAGISWSAPEFHFFEKTNTWYIGSALIAGVVVLFSLWQGNFLFVIFAIIAEILVLFWGGQAPKTIAYKLSDSGLLIGEKQIGAEKIAAYALIESLGGPNYFELILKQKQALAMYIKVLVPNERAQEVGDFLAERLEAFDYSPSIAEAIMNRLGL